MSIPHNKPDAVNPAMALRLIIGNQWRRVADPGRWPSRHNAMKTYCVISEQALLAALVVMLGVARLTVPGFAQSSEGLVGTWRLELMYVRDANGKTTPYWGDSPT